MQQADVCRGALVCAAHSRTIRWIGPSSLRRLRPVSALDKPLFPLPVAVHVLALPGFSRLPTPT